MKKSTNDTSENHTPPLPQDGPPKKPDVATNYRLVWQIIASTFFRLVLNIARRFIYPFGPALSRDLHVPLTAITAMIAVSQTTSLVGLLVGPMADRWGYRRMMLAGVLMLTAGMLLCWIAPIYGVVFVGLMLASAAKTTYDPAVQAFIGQRVPFARRGLAIGVVETAWAGSTLVGIPVMALVIDGFGLRWAFFCMALLGALGWILLIRVMPPDNLQRSETVERSGVWSSLKQLIKVRPAAGMLGFGFWISMANDNLFVVYGAWLEGSFAVSIVALGISTSVIGGAELLGESLTALIGDRIGLKRAVLIGLCLATTGYLVLPLVGTSLPVALCGLFLIFMAFEFTIVSSFGLSTEILPASRATMMAGFYATAGLGRMAGAITGGVLWTGHGLVAISVVSASATVVGMLCLIWGLHGWRADHRTALEPPKGTKDARH